MRTGRPPKIIDHHQVSTLRQRGVTWERIAAELQVSRSTLDLVRKDLMNSVGLGSKRCSDCQRVLPVLSFSVDNSRRDGRYVRCRDCVSEAWKRANSSPCVQCGSWRRSPTPGHCRRCYIVNARIANLEYEILATIPWMIAEHERALLESVSQAQRDAYKEARKLKNRALLISLPVL